jgi:hypothetical protein
MISENTISEKKQNYILTSLSIFFASSVSGYLGQIIFMVVKSNIIDKPSNSKSLYLLYLFYMVASAFLYLFFCFVPCMIVAAVHPAFKYISKFSYYLSIFSLLLVSLLCSVISSYGVSHSGECFSSCTDIYYVLHYILSAIAIAVPAFLIIEIGNKNSRKFLD